MPGMAVGFSGWLYDQIIIFQSAEMLWEALDSNLHMEPIIGAGGQIDKEFPGVYVAGIRAKQQPDNTADGYEAFRKNKRSTRR